MIHEQHHILDHVRTVDQGNWLYRKWPLYHPSYISRSPRLKTKKIWNTTSKVDYSWNFQEEVESRKCINFRNQFLVPMPLKIKPSVRFSVFTDCLGLKKLICYGKCIWEKTMIFRCTWSQKRKKSHSFFWNLIAVHALN